MPETLGIDAADQVVPVSALVAALFDGPKPLADRDARRALPYLPEQCYWLLEELETVVERAAMRTVRSPTAPRTPSRRR
jgi:hypothetical protein